MGLGLFPVGMMADVGGSANNPEQLLLCDFTERSVTSSWRVQDDGVMGGLSQGNVFLNDQGHAVFSGYVTLENNGGFSSIQSYFPSINVSAFTTAVLRIRGDGKRYQFRVGSSPEDRISYRYTFSTSGDWETIEIPLQEMIPTWRGRRLNRPNYPGKTLGHLRFLIANGKAENFQLEIESIWLK